MANGAKPRRTAGSQAVIPDRIVLRQRGPERLRRRRIGARARDLPQPEPRRESLRGAGSNFSPIQRDGAVDLSLVRGMGGQAKPGLRGPWVGRIALDQRAEPARCADPIGAVGRTIAQHVERGRRGAVAGVAFRKCRERVSGAGGTRPRQHACPAIGRERAERGVARRGLIGLRGFTVAARSREQLAKQE